LLGLSEGEQWVYFDLACHAGTWLALAYFLRKEIWEVLRDVRKIGLYTLALMPLIPAYFLLKPYRTPAYTGYFLLLTAALLFLAAKKRAVSHEKKWTSVLFIGMMQGLALLPGLSRSGSTIAAARFCKWEWIDAARFSFLLAIPTILGGEVLESYKLLKGGQAEISLPHCAIGFLASFTVGLATVRLVFWMYEQKMVKPFAWYCLGLGLLMIWIFHA
jgi:undecaprenyl-diphosphatase